MTAAKKVTVGIIGGLGWLGSALLTSALANPKLNHVHFVVSSRRSPSKTLGDRVTFTHNNQYLVEQSTLVVLSIRPQDWPSLPLTKIDSTVMSFMAGTSCEAIQERHQPTHLIRALPNGACSVNQSYTPWFCASDLPSETETLIVNLLDSIGYQDRYEHEDQIDVLTAISGAGPAYPALLAQGLEQSAIALGIPADKARKAVNATLQGSAALSPDLSQSPGETVALLESYQGTTAAGLAAMKASGFSGAIESGVRSAYLKALHFNQPKD